MGIGPELGARMCYNLGQEEPSSVPSLEDEVVQGGLFIAAYLSRALGGSGVLLT